MTVARSEFGVRLRLDLTDEIEIDLAHPVDLPNHNGHLVAKGEVVLDSIDTAVRVDLGDVQQAVPAGQDVDEGAELGDVDDLTLVLFANFGFRWKRHLQDALLGRRERLSIR